MIEDKVLRSYLLGTFLALYREKGKSKMEDMVGLTLACLNIKKLVKMMVGKTCYFIQIPQYYWIMRELSVNIKKDKHQKRCLSSF